MQLTPKKVKDIAPGDRLPVGEQIREVIENREHPRYDNYRVIKHCDHLGAEDEDSMESDTELNIYVRKE